MATCISPSLPLLLLSICEPFFQVIRHNCFSTSYAVCVGQATNPGPCDGNIRLAVCNPTAIHGKAGALLTFQADVICALETSATSVIQKDVSKDRIDNNFKSFWSPPVAPRKNAIDNGPSYRGEAVGAAVFSFAVSK